MKRCAVLVVVGYLAASCGRHQTPAETPAPPLPTVFAFTNRAEVVTGEAAQTLEQGRKSVVVDFNQDGLKDLAVVDEMVDGQASVGIYIQQRAEESQPPVMPADGPASPPSPGTPATGSAASPSPVRKYKTIYYRAGQVRRHVTGRIIGLASRDGASHTDLIVLVAHSNAPNEMIHYQNDGSSLREVTHFGNDGAVIPESP